MSIMHGFGDFDNVSNLQTAKLMETYLLTEWLPIFVRSGNLKYDLLLSLYAQEITDYKKMKSMRKWVQTQLGTDQDHLAMYMFDGEANDVEDFLSFMPREEEDEAVDHHLESIKADDEWKELYTEISKQLSVENYKVFNTCRNNTLLPKHHKGNEHNSLFQQWINLPKISTSEEEHLAHVMLM